MNKDERIPIDEPIPSLDTVWDNGTYAYTGQRIEQFIKDELRKIPPQIIVDEELNENSSAPVQNRAIATRLAEIESRTVDDMAIEVSEDESIVTLMLMDKNSNVIAECDIPALGGSGDSDATALKVTAAVDRASVSEGGSVLLSYSYDHVYSSGDNKGESTGTHADITVTVKKGETVMLRRTENNCACGDYTLDLTPYLRAGTNEITVSAEYYDTALGKRRAKQTYARVEVVAFHLSTTATLTTQLQTGGCGSTANVPFTVSGNGNKRIYIYVDGVQTAYKEISATAPTTDSFSINTSSLSPGMHTVQMVGRVTISGEEYTSESVWMTLMKEGATPMVGILITNTDGRILEGAAHRRPTMSAKAFEEITVKWGAYDSSRPAADAEVLVDGEVVQSVRVDRTQQTLTNRFTSQGQHTLTVRCGSATVEVTVDVTAGAVSVQEAAGSLVCKLSAAGRSNNEGDRAVWEDNGVGVTFEGVDWVSSGWTGSALRLMGGAKATVNTRPFALDNGVTGARAEGLTIEFTLNISNITDESAVTVSCYDPTSDKGLQIKGNEIAFLTGQTVTYTDEEGEEQTRESKLTANYVDGKRMKVAFIIRKALKEAVVDGQQTQLADRVMEMYINGNRCAADTYEETFSFAQSEPARIVFDSTGALIELESVRVYSRALSDDEELMNDIYDEPNPTTLYNRYMENDVLGNDGGVDINAILRRGKGVIKIVRQGKLNDVYITNNKKTDFRADVYYYSPLGAEHNFVLQGCKIRIQGTSSTKYPSKNIRFYIKKGYGDGGKPVYFEIGGEQTTNYKYSLYPGTAAQGILTAKSDYSDSSMSLNTGGAKLFNAAMIELGLLTPPQQWQLEHGGTITARQAIDGIPVDMFVAESADAEPEYVGQYNLNNEKSESEDVFGMKESGGFIPACPIALESLNNLQKLCLFQAEDDVDAQLDRTFGDAFEFNYPKDTFWTQAGIDNNGGDGTLANEAQRAAIRRLITFFKDSVPAGADPDHIETFISPYFREHASEYFDIQHLLTYYDFTDRLVSVDQRAKNIMWRTWDGLKWYATYYDGDTARGKRNDSYMVYGPETERTTWDAQRSKYAFEGYTSWLWCLMLANFQTELAAASSRLGEVLGVERVLDMLLNEQSGNWSDREFNKSGEIKYINPAIRPFPEGADDAKLWPFIFALQGADRSHSEWFIRERWKLMGAKYAAGNFTADCLPITLSRAESDPTDYITVEMAKLYASGYGTNNNANIYSTGIVEAGVPARMPVSVGLNANDPIRIYGASRIRRIDMSECYQRVQGSFDVSLAARLEEIDMHVPTGKSGYSRGWYLAGLRSCPLLRVLDLSGQREASTSDTLLTLDLSANANLQELYAKGTMIGSLTTAAGAPLHTLQLPGTLTSLTLNSLHSLTDEGFDIEGYDNLTTLDIRGCEHLDVLAIVTAWLGTPGTKDTLTLQGVNWQLATDDTLMRIVRGVRNVNITGHITVIAPIMESHDAELRAKFGDDYMAEKEYGLTITADPSVIMNDESNPRMMEVMRALGITSGTSLTKAQAQAVGAGYGSDSIYKDFMGNNGNPAVQAVVSRWAADEVVTFHEFKYFTGLRCWISLAYLPISEVTLPPNLTGVVAISNTRLKRIALPEGCTELRYGFFENSPCEYADLNKISTLKPYAMGASVNLKTIIFRGEDLPTFVNGQDGLGSVGSSVPAGEPKVVYYAHATEASLTLWQGKMTGWTFTRLT